MIKLNICIGFIDGTITSPYHFIPYLMNYIVNITEEECNTHNWGSFIWCRYEYYDKCISCKKNTCIHMEKQGS